jgi:hypothetical protein
MDRNHEDEQRLVYRDAFPAGDSAETSTSPDDLTVNCSNQNTFNLKIKRDSHMKDHSRYKKQAWTTSARVYKVL